MFKNMIRRGFTLVELIIVLVIVGLLGAIAIAGYSAVVDKAEEEAVKATLKSLDNEYRALDAFTIADGGNVLVADMTQDADVKGDLTYNDVDTDGLESCETVTYSYNGVSATLTLADAGSAGTIVINP